MTPQRAWCFYDWANSAYNLVIISTIFPIYYAAITKGANGLSMVQVLGKSLPANSLYAYVLSAASLTIAFINPALSGIADGSGQRMAFLRAFCYLGSISCMGLFFFTPSTFWLGLTLFYLAAAGFSGSLVFYNSYLPDLAAPPDRDKLSAQGFAYGYVGSVVLLVLSLLPILKPGWFGGISSGLASRVSFLATGIWWFGFAHITFDRMPKDVRTKAGSIAAGIKRGIKTTIATGRTILQDQSLVRYLPAFFFYNMGVQTIMALATLFGSAELHMDSGALITTILLLQIVAIFGAMLTARASHRFGNKPVLLVLILVWIGVCIAAYGVQTAAQFQCLASVVGLMMGGIQSLSRSTFSKLLPPQEVYNQASYFSFMDVVDRLSIVFGTFAFGFVQQLTGSMRMSALVLCGFFIVGGLLLFRLRVTKPIAAFAVS